MQFSRAACALRIRGPFIIKACGCMSQNLPIRPGQILTGSLFQEAMRVETVRPIGSDTWTVGLVGLRTERFVASRSRLAISNLSPFSTTSLPLQATARYFGLACKPMRSALLTNSILTSAFRSHA